MGRHFKIKLSPETFESFIDTSYDTAPKVQPTPLKIQMRAIIRPFAEEGMRELREILKGATKEEQIVLNELIDLKVKEFDIIYNYIKRR